MWRCLLRVLYPVRRPMTTLDFALLKDINAVLAADEMTNSYTNNLSHKIT
jgi:hypothetical protein